MAERRMFHTSVVESDAFLDLPLGAQALYFHMGMHADDDGFVNGPRQITRTIGTAAKNLELLVEKGFLLRFGDVVVVKHWRMANSLKSDRLRPPRYPEIADKLYMLTTKAYTLNGEPGMQTLAENKRILMEEYRHHLDSQKRRGEKKGEEKKGEEKKVEEKRIEEDGIPAGEGAAATADTVPEFLKGELGKGVVLLSEAQIADLLEKMGLDGFDHYVDKLSDFILKSGAKIKNHYATILKWWQEDKECLL